VFPVRILLNRGIVLFMCCKYGDLSIMFIYLEEKIRDDIIEEFGRALIQYICVAHEVGGASSKSHLHIQIILKRPVNKQSWFLDKYTGIFFENVYFRCLTIVCL